MVLYEPDERVKTRPPAQRPGDPLVDELPHDVPAACGGRCPATLDLPLE
jgi:hypothetical protein